MEVTLGLWAVTILGIAVLIVLDFVTVSRKPHEVMFKEALAWSIFYIGIAVAFGVAMWVWQGGDIGTQYFAAYLVEKSLSVDNLFVFIIILTQFAVPADLHQRVLLVGVVLALIMRAVFIAIGAAALAAFAFTFVIFGAILIWTGIQLARHRNEDPEPQDNVVVRVVRRRFLVSEQYDGTRLFTRIDGRRAITPLLLVMIAIGSTDLLFALDSIPATFGVTQIPYLVFAANAFALLGLRALYFLLKGLLDKLVYLSTGLSVILVFIGVKLVLTYLHEVNPSIPHITTLQSLAFILIVLTVVTVASWWKVRRDPTAVAHAGRVTAEHHGVETNRAMPEAEGDRP
ncbi:MAG: TerC/Alx family metal homeostasis membrane protein [Actinomycetales bacterium]|nr:TerC/Alx family metal homeostasis membrane protein [Actinomycetales bacterium]